MSSILVNSLSSLTIAASLAALKIPIGLTLGLLGAIPKIVDKLLLNSYDFYLYLINVLTPPLKKGQVIAIGNAGHGGIWPEFVPPTDTDSRSPCPYLNALANHGILPHDGRSITMKQINTVLHGSLNFATTMCKDTTDSVKSLYGRDVIDLSDLSAHNVIEHDASLVRHDAQFEPNQSLPAKDLIKQLLSNASGPASAEHPDGYLTTSDIARVLALREAQSKRDNRTFRLGLLHRFFGASNASLMYEVVQGDVRQLKTILYEERFPDGFESWYRGRKGYTLFEFHNRSAEIFFKQPAKVAL